MPVNYPGSDSWVDDVRLRAQTDQVLGGLDGPANVGTQDVADRTVYLKAQIIRDITEQVELASGGKATIRQDAGGNIDYFAKIGAYKPNFYDSDLGSDNGVHPAFKVNDVTKDYFLMSILPGIKATVGSTDYMVPVNDQIPADIALSSLRTICTNKGTGYHLMTLYEYAAVVILGLKAASNYNVTGGTFRDYLAGNTDSGKFDVGNGEQFGILEDPSTPENTLPGSGPLQWRHDGSPWGVADLVGNYEEVIDLIKTINGQIYLPVSGGGNRDNYYSQAEGSWTATGIYWDTDGSGGLKLNTSTTIPTSSLTKGWTSIALDAALITAGNPLVDSSFICDTLISPQWNDSGATNPVLINNARGNVSMDLATATHYFEAGGKFDDQSLAGCAARLMLTTPYNTAGRCCLIE